MGYFGTFEDLPLERGRFNLPSSWVESAVRETKMSLPVFSFYRMHNLRALNVQPVRNIPSEASYALLDKNSRIVIPQQLRDFLQVTDKITLVGLAKDFEIWNPESYHLIKEPITESSFAELAAAFGI